MELDSSKEKLIWGKINELRGSLPSTSDFKKLCLIAYEELDGSGQAETFIVGEKNSNIEGIALKNSENSISVTGQNVISTYKEITSLGIDLIGEMIEFLSSYDGFENKSVMDKTINEVCTIVESMIPQGAETVVDLCSGAGNFLINCAYTGKECTGYEFNIDTAIESRIRAKINKVKFDVHVSNVLSTRIGKKFDFVFSEFPWGMYYGDEYVSEDDSKFEFDVNRKKADWLFIKKAIDLMNEHGKAVVLVPNYILMAATENQIRKLLIEKGLLEKIIIMPENTLKCTSVGYSILVFSQGNKLVETIDARNMTMEVFKRKKLDVDKIIDSIKNNDKFATIEMIKEKNFNLFQLFLDESKLPEIKDPIKLSEVAEVIGGFQYTSKSVTELDPGEGNIGIVRIADMEDGKINFENTLSANLDEEKISKYLLKENDIIMATKGTKISISFVQDIDDKKYIPNSNLTIIRVTDENQINPIYLYLYLTSETGRAYLSSIQTGAIIINISKASLLKLDIPKLDMDTQETMANRYLILDQELDELKKKMDVIKDRMDNIYEMEVEQ